MVYKIIALHNIIIIDTTTDSYIKPNQQAWNIILFSMNSFQNSQHFKTYKYTDSKV